MKIIYNKILPLLIIFPISSYGSNIKLTKDKKVDSGLNSIKNFNSLSFSKSALILSYKPVLKLVGDEINKDSSFKVNFHEETTSMDFSALNAISITIHLAKSSGAPPNGIGS